MSEQYRNDFFAKRHGKTVDASITVLKLLLDCLPPVRSCVDVGCGVGTWLSTLRSMGIEDVTGLDGPWVDTSLLRIPAERFRVTRLDHGWSVGRRFDLAISLEVAEHLPAEAADGFVRSLTQSADFVLFSAAIPGQGGVHHFNEQPASYWAAKFARHGFEVKDILRSHIWNVDHVPICYRQNCLVFVRSERSHEVGGTPSGGPLDIVHPELLRLHLASFQGPRAVVRVARRTFRQWARSRS